MALSDYRQSFTCLPDVYSHAPPVVLTILAWSSPWFSLHGPCPTSSRALNWTRITSKWCVPGRCKPLCDTDVTKRVPRKTADWVRCVETVVFRRLDSWTMYLCYWTRAIVYRLIACVVCRRDVQAFDVARSQLNQTFVCLHGVTLSAYLLMSALYESR